MAQDIMPENFEGIINNITVSHHLSFSEDEVPIEGKSHNQPLYIAVKCSNYMIARLLIKNGSSLNVMPKDHFEQAVLNRLHPQTSSVVVMDIQPAYSCLLGRPWIHALGAVPSSLHQKKKKLIISTPLPVEYVEGDEEALETSFQALEIVGITSVEAKEEGSKLSRAAIMATKVLISNGFQPYKGLGMELDSIAEPVALQENPERSRLGYIGIAKERRPERRAQGKKWIQPDFYRHFTSGGIISQR
ncbi:hypothetical protein CR513_46671, partial [Mucuna pruriens]